MNDTKDLSDLEIRLGESDGFRRSQVSAMSDLAAHLHGELAVLRRQIAKPAEDLVALVAELKQTIAEKDAQIVEQSNTIVTLRARLEVN